MTTAQAAAEAGRLSADGEGYASKGCSSAAGEVSEYSHIVHIDNIPYFATSFDECFDKYHEAQKVEVAA